MPSDDAGTWLDDELFLAASQAAEGISRFTLEEPLRILVYVVPFVLFAVAAWMVDRSAPGGLGGFFRFVFPRSVYKHRSTFVDLQVLLAGALIFPSIAALGATVTALVAAGIGHGLAHLWPQWSGWLPNEPLVVAAMFTLSLALVYDLATWISHFLHHRVPVLWEFHKVHHSAEVLSPLTAFRHHPVYEILSEVVDVLIAGPFLGVAYFVLAGPTDALTILGVHVVFVAFQFTGAGLRHSHMWLSFGPWLSRVLISPAQHQIHHSVDPRHYDRNFGEVFAIWDWMFGTLYIPKGREAITFGVGEPQEHHSVWSAWVGPFVGLVKQRRSAPLEAGGGGAVS